MRSLAVALGLLLIPLGFLVWLRAATNDRLSELSDTPEPVVMVAAETVSDHRQGVQLVLEWGVPTEVAAPEWYGTVTSVGVAPGETIEDGDQVAIIDGIARRGFVGETPFYRSLAAKATGTDVFELESLLVRWGFFEDEPDQTFTTSTAAAVTRLGVSLGVSDPRGLFDPSWVVWLGDEPLQIASTSLKAGFPAPSPGSAVITGRSNLLGVGLSDGSGTPLFLEGEWILSVAGLDLKLQDSEMAPEELSELADVVPDDSLQVGGMIRKADAPPAVVVPATAVVVDSDGTTCVFVEASGFEARIVELGDGGISNVDVISGLVDGDRVLVNPGDALEVLSCH